MGPAPRRAGKRRPKPLRRLVYWSMVLSLWLVIGAASTMVWVAISLPPIQSLEIPKRPPSIEIAGHRRQARSRRAARCTARRVTLKDLPPYLPKAFIAIEDRRFYSHFGVDPIGLARAVAANVLRRGVAQGGSTITQQLAKNLFLTQERTFWRKLQEVVLALWLERKFSKNEILELYLNRVYFGAGAYGVDAAAQRYFGKRARQVTLAEAAMLAGLVQVAVAARAHAAIPTAPSDARQIVLDGDGRRKASSPSAWPSARSRSRRTRVKRSRHRLASTTSPTGSWTCSTTWSATSTRISSSSTTIDPALQAAAENGAGRRARAEGRRSSTSARARSWR